MSFAGKVAVVTGASRGIGRAVALRLARAGAEVVGVARGPEGLHEVGLAVASEGGSFHPIAGDLSDAGFVHRLFAEVAERFGRLDLLVNNAGIAPFGSVVDLPPEELTRCLEVNVVAVFACIQEAVRLMRGAGTAGRILSIGSVRSHWTEAGDAGAYNASKFALRALTESIARELHGEGCRIAIGMICPGVVDTPLTNPSGEPRPDWLLPETVADAVLYAASAPDDVNVYDVTLFPTSQRPW